ncbi:MAG: phosphoribosyltransferase [Desulfobacterales bacterium]|nr:phosphoribosyltransferase [Desulfobacterales bacterium]
MPKIHEKIELRNRTRVFKDRFDAGVVLGEMLAPAYGGADDVMVLTIPMGGVPVAVKIAEILDCPLDLIIVRKIQIPGNTEAGFGAMTQEGDVFLNEVLMTQLGLTEEQVERQSAKVRGELAERNRRLRGECPFPDLSGKTVVIVDDGLASGFTMKASVYMVNKRKAAKTIVAVPTAPLRSIDSLGRGVDEVYCANVREVFSFAVADAYENWYDLSEKEVRFLLSEAGAKGS